ncbi:lycopene cyclase [Subtercola boreus]|uniref:Lycopene cyclase n=1 Tax=Subtercola boreus TaxID=120213 RepID=A0A3E0VM20_9MICO|nr:lycopene cyclase domain-containing protein [Subtercola boreus]RFA10669.1 lycopene cyclase [Subtercola boreus]TQL55771.1 lycopene cyclase domain-containing protein [Subtercola boreus]
MTYWTLNAIFLVVTVALAIAARLVRRRPRLLPLAVTVLVLFVISVVFDNVMIGVGLVGYNRDLISGAFLGIAPLEDFAYVFGAVLLLPALWYLLPTARRRSADRRSESNS